MYKPHAHLSCVISCTYTCIYPLCCPALDVLADSHSMWRELVYSNYVDENMAPNIWTPYSEMSEEYMPPVPYSEMSEEYMPPDESA